MDRGRKHKKKGTKKKKATPMSSGKEYLKKMDFRDINIANPEEFLNHTLKNIKEKTNEITAHPFDIEKRHAIENDLKPMNVTPVVKERIKSIPRSKAVSWYIHSNLKYEADGPSKHCHVYLVDEKNLLDQESKLVACIGVCIERVENLRRKHGNREKNTMGIDKDLILGTFAKTCLNPDSVLPLRGLCSGQNVLPAEVILNTSGLVEILKLDLMELGVSRISIAHSGLITDGMKSFRKTTIKTRPLRLDIIKARDQTQLLAKMKESINENLRDNGEEQQYVSEERQDLKGWVPPNTFAPPQWFVKRPEKYVLFEPEDMYGWRTNLRRALENVDESKVIEITNAHSVEDVREFCEISNLLRKMAGLGLKESSRLLIEYCSVSVEGAQAPHIKEEWWQYMSMPGDKGRGSFLTPLMQAASGGYYETCELLLDNNADVNAANKEYKYTALHYALQRGHKDVVKLLCKRNADISHVNYEGCDSIAWANHIINNKVYERMGGTARQFERIAEILREYDYNCCSYCKNSVGRLRLCPCHKERYCDRECQMNRWHCHKVLHKKVLRNPKQLSCGRSANDRSMIFSQSCSNHLEITPSNLLCSPTDLLRASQEGSAGLGDTDFSFC